MVITECILMRYRRERKVKKKKVAITQSIKHICYVRNRIDQTFIVTGVIRDLLFPLPIITMF